MQPVKVIYDKSKPIKYEGDYGNVIGPKELGIIVSLGLGSLLANIAFGYNIYQYRKRKRKRKSYQKRKRKSKNKKSLL
jgi:hypothetical protein